VRTGKMSNVTHEPRRRNLARLHAVARKGDEKKRKGGDINNP